MKHMSLQEIATACGGTYYGDTDSLSIEVTGVAIDSRKIENGYLFIPIKGARVDGHDFIPQVMEQGALCTLSEKKLSIHIGRFLSGRHEINCRTLPHCPWD